MNSNIRSGTTEQPFRVRRIDESDATSIVIDCGPAESAVHAEIVEGTLVIVGPDDSQHEVDLPFDSPRMFMHNGVITIEGEE